MDKLKVLLAMVLLAGLFVAACGPDRQAVSTSQAKTPANGWQSRWDGVVEAAKKEGKVVVYGPPINEFRDALTKKFGEKYGLSVDYTGAVGPEIAAKIDSERRAGLYNADALIGASSYVITNLKPAGYLEPIERYLILPEVASGDGWWNNQFPWVDKDHFAVAFGIGIDQPVLINTDVVKNGEIKSLRDLLDPKWKGTMIMSDPTVAGPAMWFVASQNAVQGIDYLRQLAAQAPTITRDRNLLAESVARAKYPIGIAPGGERVPALIKAGAPVQYADLPGDTIEAGASSGFLSLPGNAPHRNASTLFINWLLSKEGQTVFQEATTQPSTRKDIPAGAVMDAFVLKSQGKYFACYTEEFLAGADNQLKLARDIFGPLLK